jgi:hypothetical protein
MSSFRLADACRRRWPDSCAEKYELCAKCAVQTVLCDTPAEAPRFGQLNAGPKQAALMEEARAEERVAILVKVQSAEWWKNVLLALRHCMTAKIMPRPPRQGVDKMQQESPDIQNGRLRLSERWYT